MKLTVSQKLGIAVGIPIVLLIAVAVVLYVQVQRIEANLAAIVQREEPISAAAYEVEINTLGSGLAVLAYAHDRNPDHLNRLKKDVADFEQFHRQFVELVDSDEQRRQAERLSQLFATYQQHADRVIADANGQADKLRRFEDLLDQMDTLLDDQLQANIKPDDPQRVDKLQAAMELEINVNGIAKGVQRLLTGQTDASQQRIDKDEEDFRRYLKSYRELPLSQQETDQAGELERLFDQSVTLAGEIVELEKARKSDIQSLVATREQLDTLMDDEIQRQTRDRLQAHEVSTEQLATVTRWTVVVFALAAVFGGGGLAVLITRKVIHNLRLLTQHAQRIEETRELTEATSVVGSDEVGQLGRAFNAMTDALRQSQKQLFRATVESAPTAMVMIDGEGCIVLVNAETEKLFGYARDELLSQPIEILVPERFRPQHPDHRNAFLANPEPRGMGLGRELFALRKDGSEFPVEIGLSPVETDDGLFVLSAIADITERKRYEDELKQYAADLERTNKDLDEFAYVASHDLRSPLDAIKSLAEWIAEDNAETLPDASQRHIEQMRQRIGRLERLLDDLLQYSRAGRLRGEIEEVDTATLVRETVEVLSPPDGFSVSTNGELPTFHTARTPLEQVVRNLINNAVKHHDREQGTVAVTCRDAGRFFEFAVSDNGPGIAAEFHEQIFKMFETLKPRDEVEGSGMGLSVIKKIVETYGGHVTVESGDDRGTTFRFTWPKEISAAGR